MHNQYQQSSTLKKKKNTRMNYIDIQHQSQSPQFTFRFHFNETNSVPHSADLDKSLMTYNHHYNIKFKVFSLLIETSVPVYSSPLHSPQTPGIDLFIVSIVLSFPEWHIESVFFSFFSLKQRGSKLLCL